MNWHEKYTETSDCQILIAVNHAPFTVMFFGANNRVKWKEEYRGIFNEFRKTAKVQSGCLLNARVKVREKQNLYEVFFPLLFFISKTHDMRRKNHHWFLTQILEHFFKANKWYIFF